MTPGNGGSGNVSENRQVMIVLAYLGPLALVPFLLEKNDQEVQWHAKHGLVLFGAGLVLSIVATIVSTVVPCIGCILPLLLTIPILIVHIVCIVKGLNGERFLIPGLSDFADQF